MKKGIRQRFVERQLAKGAQYSMRWRVDFGDSAPRRGLLKQWPSDGDNIDETYDITPTSPARFVSPFDACVEPKAYIPPGCPYCGNTKRSKYGSCEGCGHKGE